MGAFGSPYLNTMKTYYIYYGFRPNGTLKIGCDEHYPARAKVQKLTNYGIMEEHNDIDIAGAREIELQIQYIGKRDNSQTYRQSVELLEKPFNSLFIMLKLIKSTSTL